MIDFGTVRPGTTLYIPFHTFDSNDPSASVTITGLAATDIEIYKDGSVTQRASDAGYALLDTDGIDFDALTGIHGFSVNLADNTTAGFWASGSQYWVVVSAITVDAATISFVAATFRIGYPDAILNTTIATLASQTSFTLTVGPAEDDALNGCVVCIHDVASAVQLGFAVISDYTGATKTVTLTAGVSFTAAATDNIAVFPPANTRWLGATAQTGNDVGVDVNDILTDTADMQPKLGTPAGASISADILVIDNFVDGLETTIGIAGAGLTDLGGMSTTMKAQVESEANDALVALNLDHLVGTAVGIPAIPAGTFIDQMMDDGTAVFDRTTDSLQAIRDTAPLGTAMRGTDSAALASVCTEARLAELDAANLITDVANVKTDTAAILVDTGTTLDGRIPAALVGGKMDANVGTKTVGLALTAQEKADVNAEVVDALNVDTYAEPGQEAPPATTTLVKKIGYVFKALRNRFTQDATTAKLYADNATTVDQKATVSDDGTTYDRGELGTGP